MKKTTWRLMLLAVVLSFAASVSADNDHETGVVSKFDLDHDGLVTRSEYDESFDRKMKKKLKWLDINKDGVISPVEFIGRHRDEFDKRWAKWDTNNDDIISVDVVLKQQQASRQAENQEDQKSQ
ncbi:MAG: hypothetical protein QNJ78_04430 [Gammaproteobacteria bacterium]|nr:hypothetical protein [Gammaproteobacteria bacterium]